MILIVPERIRTELTEALERSGKREIGGIIMGEHVGPDTFLINEITIQRSGGTFASFVRLVESVLTPLRLFFVKTKHNYTRFNYLGEWHSHHSFELVPSQCDDSSMRDLIMDCDLGANFVVLLLVKLNVMKELQCSVKVYQPNAEPFSGMVSYIDGDTAHRRPL